MTVENQFMGSRKSKMWTYLILLLVLVVGVLVANLAMSNPEIARNGVQSFLGLPSWALTAVAFVIGVGIYAIGLKIEADWPEALGAFVIAGSIAAGQMMIGWDRFAVGGLFVLPYLLPIVVFLVLLMYGMKRST